MTNIKLAPGPANAGIEIRHALTQLHHSPDSLFGGLPPRDSRIGMHHRIFDLDPQDIGNGLSGARLAGSRYLLANGHDVVAAAETESETGLFRLINTGPFVQGFAAALRRAESLQNDGHYTLNLLRIAPLYVMALWLEAEDGGSNWIVPLQPAPGFLTSQCYTDAEFLAALQAPAEKLSSTSGAPAVP